MTPQELETGLAQFTGTETWHRHGMFRQLLMTDGVMFLQEHAGAYWLIDAIGSHVFTNRKLSPQRNPFQVWTFRRSGDGNAPNQPHRLFATDGNSERAIIAQKIEFSDFPLPEIRLYVVWDGGFNGFVVMLPREY